VNGHVEPMNNKNDRLFAGEAMRNPGKEELIDKRLLFDLQSTLDTEQLLSLFFQHLKTALPCQQLVFSNKETGLSVRVGTSARHCADYQLKVAGEDLGTIRFHRRKPFSEAELERIETLLSALMLPLRNALHYQLALQAASRDPLTGLNNRRAFGEHLEREISRARRENQSLGLMVLDIDWFKRINDEIGHLAGDQVLVEVAAALKQNIRRSDMLFRFAGDEFVLLLPNISERGLEVLRTRLQDAVSNLRCTHRECNIPVSVSIGSSLLGSNMEGKELFEKADLDMLTNKEKKHRQWEATNQRVG